MNKQDLLNELSATTGMAKSELGTVVDSLFDLISAECAKGTKVSIPGFGSFSLSERSARTGRNPRTGEEIQIAASKSVKLTVAKKLKDLVNS